MKLGIIGTGNVGNAIALAAVARGSAREIVLVNRTRKVAEAVATDLRYGIPLGPRIDISDGDYDALNGAGVVLITSGVNEKTGGATDRSDAQGRLRLLEKNAAIYRDIVPNIVSAAPPAGLVAVSDPPDALADIARKIAGHDRVLSTGTFLDSLRFRVSAPTLVLIPSMSRRRSSATTAHRRCSCGHPPVLPACPWRGFCRNAAEAWQTCAQRSRTMFATPTSPSSKAMMRANMASVSYQPALPKWGCVMR